MKGTLTTGTQSIMQTCSSFELTLCRRAKNKEAAKLVIMTRRLSKRLFQGYVKEEKVDLGEYSFFMMDMNQCWVHLMKMKSTTSVNWYMETPKKSPTYPPISAMRDNVEYVRTDSKIWTFSENFNSKVDVSSVYCCWVLVVIKRGGIIKEQGYKQLPL